MNKFGVCYCVLNEYVRESEIKDLTIFDTLDEAYADYLKKMNENNNPQWIPDDLWLVWIDTERNMIVQFEQMKWLIKTKLIELF